MSDLELVQGRTRLEFDGDADETTHYFNGHLRGTLEAASARPFLTASNLARNFDRFSFRQPLALDVDARTLVFTNFSSFDPHLLADWLTEKGRAQLATVLWTRPPTLEVAGALTVPPWTNEMTGWRDEIAPTVRINGQFAFTNAVAAGRTLDFLQTHFGYTNQF